MGSVTYGCFPLEEAQGDVHRDAGVGEDGGGLSVGRHVAADICKGNSSCQPPWGHKTILIHIQGARCN